MPELMSPGECRPVGRAYLCHLRMANVAFVVVKHLRYPVARREMLRSQSAGRYRCSNMRLLTSDASLRDDSA
jgi:hypothetical protein